MANIVTVKSQQTSYKIKKRATRIFISVFRWVFLLAISYILLYPLLYMLSAAFRAPADFVDSTVVWVSKTFTLENFKIAFQALDYANAFKNTFYIEIISALIEVVTCAITAYGLSRFEFREKKFLTFILIVTILVPTQMIMLPLRVSMNHLDILGIFNFLLVDLGGMSEDILPGVLNTPFAFYIPSIFAVGLKAGLFIFMYVQFFKGMPKELEEAAYIDGAGPLKTFIRIVVPSSGVIILTVSIFSVIWHWNDVYLSQMFIGNNSMYTLSSRLSKLYTTLDGMGYGKYARATVGKAMAGCVLVIAPMLIMYCILQRNFIKSVDRIGIVG